MQNNQNFLITRSIDYTVTRDFVVQAEDQEEAKEKLIDFCENSDWGKAAGIEHGVAEVGMREEQTDASPKITHIRDGFSLDEVVVARDSIISDTQANYLCVLVSRLMSTDAAIREQATFDAEQTLRAIDAKQQVPYEVLQSMAGPHQEESARPTGA